MKPQRVLALVDETLVPPDDGEGHDVVNAPWKMEFDVTITLKNLGHEVRNSGVGGDLGVIRKAIDEWRPHIVLNLLEHFHGVPLFDQNVVSYLEMLRTPYTGCNPRGLMLARDKGISKKLLSYHRIPVPRFLIVPRGRKVKRPKRLAFPLFVKSLTMDASIGISQASVVETDACPSIFWMDRRSAPPSRRWVAKPPPFWNGFVGAAGSAQTLGANASGSGPRGLISDSRFGADFFNRLICFNSSFSIHKRIACLIFKNKIPGKFSFLNIEKNLFHGFFCFFSYNFRPCDIISIFSRI
jgi:hypothetical protein